MERKATPLVAPTFGKVASRRSVAERFSLFACWYSFAVSLPSALAVESIVEERIQAAIRRGDFDNLPGTGKPLELDDDRLVPVEARIAHRILKNAGLVPPEVLERREIAELDRALSSMTDDSERKRALAKLALLRTRLGARRGRCLTLNAHYEGKIIEKLANN
jgi:Domain of unknown function (DUF1992)